MHVSRSVPKASTSHLCDFFHFKLSTWRQSMAQFLQGHICRESSPSWLAYDVRTRFSGYLSSRAVTKESLMHVQADEDMTKSTDLDATYSGTTACMSLVHDGHVYTANVGDSGACLGRLGPTGRIQAVELSKYARPSEPQVWLSASTTQH